MVARAKVARKMNRSTILVAIVFAGLLAGALVLFSQKPERGISRLDLGPWSKEQVTRLAFGGKDAVELAKREELWRLADGKEADSAAVERLLESLRKLRSSELLTRDEARFAELEVDGDKGTSLEAFAGTKRLFALVLGKSVAGGVAVRSGDEVFKVDGVSRAALVRQASAWRERRVFRDKVEDITRLEVQLAGAKPYALEKQGDGFALADLSVLPAGFRFDAGAARSLVTSVVNLRAKDFESEDPGLEATGLGDGADVLRLVLASSDGQQVTRVLWLGKERGEQKDVFAKVEGSEDIFTIAASTAKGLRRSVEGLRDLRLMNLEVAKAKKLAVRDGKVSLVFEKAEGGWQLQKSAEKKPEGFVLDQNAVERRLQAVAAARATRLAEPKEAVQSGLGAPAASVTVTLEDGARATLSFGKETKDDAREVVFARGNADAAAYLVAKWTRQNLTGGLPTFVKQPSRDDDGLKNLDPKALEKLPPEIRQALQKQIDDKRREQQLMRQLEAKPAPAP